MVTEKQVEPPLEWLGTRPEYAIYQALVRLKVDFEYQSSKLGGRLDRGGAVLDFYIGSLNIGISVMSEFWHYGRPEAIANDRMQRLALEAMGLQMIYIDEADALRSPFFYTKEALAGRDHSRMSRL